MIEKKNENPSVEELDRSVKDPQSLELLGSMDPSLIIPLNAKDQLMGILVLGERIHTRSYSPEEKDYLVDIAHFASHAIHNAVLFEMSTTDMMTHIKLRHYFTAVLNRRLNQSIHSGRPVSLIMADIGARYGGEEFVILLPDTDENAAFEISERLRRKIATYDLSRSGCEENITISPGVAQYKPNIDTSTDVIINRVDKALYFSKQNGRNQSSRSSRIPAPS